MPMLFDNTPDDTLHGLFRPELGLLERLPFRAPVVITVAVALAAAAVLMLTRLRSREEERGHLQ